MKLLYGTGNRAKLATMRKMLDGLGIEIVGLDDLEAKIHDVAENGYFAFFKEYIDGIGLYG